jgi:hypothetical protein
MTIRSKMSCHLLRTQICSMVHIPHNVIHPGTHMAMPNFRPNAAPTGCNVTKKAKNTATAVFRSPGFSPISFVKSAVYLQSGMHSGKIPKVQTSAFPIYSTLVTVANCSRKQKLTFDLSNELNRNSSAKKGSRMKSSLRTVRRSRSSAIVPDRFRPYSSI